MLICCNTAGFSMYKRLDIFNVDSLAKYSLFSWGKKIYILHTIEINKRYYTSKCELVHNVKGTPSLGYFTLCQTNELSLS